MHSRNAVLDSHSETQKYGNFKQEIGVKIGDPCLKKNLNVL